MSVILRSLVKLSRSSSSIRCFSSQTVTDEKKAYRYTWHDGDGLLSTAQRDFYEDNGFVVIKEVVGKEDLKKYSDRFYAYARGELKPPPGLSLQRELTHAKQEVNENTLYKIQELYADELLWQYCTDAKVLDYVQCFVGSSNIHAIHTMLINKPPDAGNKSSRHPMHQDYHYFPIRPEDRIVCAWTALERVNRDNGCLVGVPGSHRGPHLEHDYPKWEGGVNVLYHGVKDTSVLENRVHIEMEAGDCVFFHPLLIHGSGTNRTQGTRQSISSHFAAAECHYVDLTGTISEPQAREVVETFAKKFKFEGDIDYRLFWKIRAMLVRGVEVSS